jgi:peptidoglycan/xylan/chitin deacetylase (PgdA/CDA1 family)
MKDPLVLCYHAVDDGSTSALAVSPSRLDDQLRLLLRLGYRPATFADALLRPRWDRTFVVTFDDAFRSVYTNALPVLQRLGVPATLAVPTGWIGGERGRAAWRELELSSDGRSEEMDLMTWDEIREVAAAGWEIASHSVSHPRLTTIADADLEDELAASRATVAAEVGTVCESIVYPFGDVDDRVVGAAVAAGYRTGAALTMMRHSARREPHTPMRFRRIGVYPVDGGRRFAAKLAVALYAARGEGATVPEPGALAARAEPRDAPRVAVIIPCFNDGPLAKEAVASVDESEPVEVVVVDDASTEPATLAALDDLRRDGVRVLRHDVNQGLSAARRTGLAATTAPFVFPLDSDDLLVAGALSRLADRMEADPEAAAVWADVVEFGTRQRHARPPARLEGYRVAFHNDYPVCSLFRRTALERVGAWQDVGGMVGYEDWNLWMSLAERHETGYHAGPGVLAFRRRLHGPRMLGDSVTRHRRLYEELRRTHPRLFAEIGHHRRRSELSAVGRAAYPLVFGGRPPLGLRSRLWDVQAAVRERLGRNGR